MSAQQAPDYDDGFSPLKIQPPVSVYVASTHHITDPAEIRKMLTEMFDDLRGRKILRSVVSYDRQGKTTTTWLEGNQILIVKQPGVMCVEIEDAIATWGVAIDAHGMDSPITRQAFWNVCDLVEYYHPGSILGPPRRDDTKKTPWRRMIAEKFRWKCANCDVDLKDGMPWAIDHHRPYAKGFRLTEDNAVLLCRPCNSRKHDKLPEEFYQPERLAVIEEMLHA